MIMKPYHLTSSLALVVLVNVLPATAADTAAGKTLHDEHCLACHDTGVYSREKKRVVSLNALRKQVTRCEISQSMNVTPEQTESIVQYLNESFYHF
jgi:cytochrome c553